MVWKIKYAERALVGIRNRSKSTTLGRLVVFLRDRPVVNRFELCLCYGCVD